MRLDSLSSLQLDAVRELGSIGAGHAATALSQVVGSPVRITVPEARIVPVTEMPVGFGGPEALVGAVLAHLVGDVRGSIMFVASPDSLAALADLMRGRTSGTVADLGPDEERLAIHAASLLMSAYLAAIARMADVTMLPSPPAFALDMLGALVDSVTAEIGMKADVALLVLTTLSTSDTAVDGAVLFLPDEDSLDILLGSLGVG